MPYSVETIIIRKLASLDERRGFVTAWCSQSMLRLRRNRRVRFPFPTCREFKKKTIEHFNYRMRKYFFRISKLIVFFKKKCVCQISVSIFFKVKILTF